MKILILLTSVALASFSTAQNLRTVKIRTLCFEYAEELSEVLLVSGGEKQGTTPVKLWTSNFSPEVETAIDGSVVRFAVQAKGPNGEDILKTVALGKAVSGPRQLAVFIPSGKEIPYDLVMLDDSEKGFPMGSTLAVNLSPSPMRLAIGERKIELNPGDKQTIPAPLELNDRNQANVLVYFKDNKDAWLMVNNTRWLINDLTRSLAIGFIHPLTKQPMVNSYTETPPWRLPKAE